MKLKKVIGRLIGKKEISWQARQKNSAQKFEVLLPVIKGNQINSVLDVGCNAGEVTRLLGRAGIFSVGIDGQVDLRGFDNPLDKACIGNWQLDEDLISKLPEFDAILLLSVHHQWVRSFGDEAAKKLVGQLSGKAKRVFIIEFSGVNRKYSNQGGNLFIDNDEASVKDYAEKWLAGVFPLWSVSYTGKAVESKSEPYRFIFSCTRN